MDLSELIEKSRAGDTEAYRLVVRQLGPSVGAFLASRLNDFHAVEDLTQEVFVGAYKSLAKFDGKSDFRYWLLGISRHKIADYLRRQYSQNNLKAAYQAEIENVLEQEDENLPEVSGERLVKLQGCMQRLPEEAKNLIMARYFSCETVISLAERLASSENAISSKLFRLKKKLKNCIESI